ncbi:MAG: hypothetical protein H7328_10830 [Bdellovibrio sp.]|nr:hypothetical protein [Bdellovibrio sp.]
MRAKILLITLTVFIQQIATASSFNYSDEFADILNRVQLEQQSTYKVSITPVNDRCFVFLNKDNVEGPLGQAIKKEITQNPETYPFILHGGTLNNYCPKYSKLTAMQKTQIWVLIMTVMAHFESSCDLKSSARGPNGALYGYFQLHKGNENSYAGGHAACSRNASTDPKLSTRCALAMLEVQMRKSGGDLFSKNSYWDVLRPKGQSKKAHDISRAINRFSLCNPTQM